MRAWRFAAVMGMGVLSLAGAQEAAVRSLAFSLDRPGPAAVQYTMSLHEDGRGQYLSGPGGSVAAGSPASPGSGVQDDRSQPIEVSASTVKKLFAAVPAVEGGRCETHSKGIALTGVKVLRYEGAGKRAECTYNFSDDDRVNNATTAFEAIAETLQAGDRLRTKLRFDRLGLDAELDQLLGAVADHRATELENIAPVLRTIVADDRVMDRVHRKAEQLLNQAVVGTQARQGASASER